MKRLVWPVVLSLVVAGGLRTLTGAMGDSRTVDSRTFWRLKTHPGQQFDGLLVGDSRTYRGLSPTVMEPFLSGRRVHNLGYSSGRLSRDLFDHAEGLLNPEAQPPFIVLGLSAHALSKAKQGPENPQLARYLDLGDWEQRLDLWARPLTQHVFRPLVADPTVALQMARQGEGRVRYHQRFDERGFVASITEPVDPQRALKSYGKTLREHPVDPGVVRVLIDRVARWHKAGVSVYILRLPVPAAMDDLERGLGGFDERQLRMDLARAGGHWLGLETKDLSTYDGSHLDPESARRLSQRVAEAIATDLSLDPAPKP
ncbi:MAG: hypothetical protein CMH55_05220 [Myxococcales bacterium]|nr:hypothetical protein [Myxococcales bacterium]